ncbi:hypothetical protein GQF01_00145 [Paenibacillus sp. 5J-6]|uniref:HTH luxR-type domain-containing protein n=1 Tax=Paenibacillus silvestris TaxID=2606219 RepID=A0A6L8UTW6_9BACL|nr:helix-turn-helix transcriptional regulator [Paenibacillus silvestris]MZQ80570.1 hypothetical protein [Paenibacillus silvestris]
MFNLFRFTKSDSTRNWFRLNDLEESTVISWNQLFRTGNKKDDSTRFTYHLSGKKLREKLEINKNLLLRIRKEHRENIASVLIKPHLFALIDTDGILIDICGDKGITKSLKKYKVIGVSLSMKHAGINPYSVSKELNATSVIVGKENTLKLFHQFTAICTPLRVADEVIAYIGLVIQIDDDIDFAVALLEQYAKTLQDKQVDVSEDKLIRLNRLFEEYSLTKREREVAILWLQNQPTSLISFSLCITEGTVWNMIKKIYRKTNVRGKVELVTKFLVNQN